MPYAGWLLAHVIEIPPGRSSNLTSKEQLRALLRTNSLADAASAKEELKALVEAAGRPETNKLYRTVCRWWKEIEVLIVTGATTGKVEAQQHRNQAHQTHCPRLPQRRELQIDYSHEKCRPDGGMTLIRESISP